MLPKRLRLPIHRTIGLSPIIEARSPYATIKCFKSKAADRRVGVVVPKKVFTKPTDRNRAKRAVFSVFEKQEGLFPGTDVLIIMRPQAAFPGWNEFIRHIAGFIEKTHRNFFK